MVFVTLGLSILVFTTCMNITSLIFVIFKFKFPAQLYQTSLFLQAVVRLFWISRLDYNRHYFNFSCCSSVAQLSSVFLFEFPAGILTVIITLNLSMSAVSLVSFNVSNFFSVSEFLPKTACYFLFSCWRSMSENHIDACRIVDAYFRLNLEW